jgi:hypothetical protein
MESAFGPYPEPDEYNPYSFTLFPKDPSHILPSAPRSSEWSLPFRLCEQMFAFFVSPVRATCPAHIIIIIVVIAHMFVSLPLLLLIVITVCSVLMFDPDVETMKSCCVLNSC